MGIAVYPLLGLYLQTSPWSVADLTRQVEARFGLQVQPDALAALLGDGSIQQMDLELAGAVASVLHLRLGDLFLVTASGAGDGPYDPAEAVDDELVEPTQSDRLTDLLEMQDMRGLAAAEQAEAADLLTRYHERLHKLRIRQIATQRGVPLEQARRDVEAAFAQALSRWHEVEADPTWRHNLEIAAKHRRKTPVE